MTLRPTLKAPLTLVSIFVLAPVLAIAAWIGWSWPGKWSLESEVGIAAAPEFIYPYISRLERWSEWSAADTHGWQKLDSAVDRSVQYRIPLQYRSHADLGFILASENKNNASRLKMVMQVDLGWKVLARHAHRDLREETVKGFEVDMSRLRALAENDAKLAAAQNAADADSVSLVPLDTVSTEVQPAE
jgi:hypothetical protein